VGKPRDLDCKVEAEVVIVVEELREEQRSLVVVAYREPLSDSSTGVNGDGIEHVPSGFDIFAQLAPR
jgi:hypothetical protein